MTNANSEPCESRNPSWVDPGTDQRNTRLAAMLVMTLTATKSAATPTTAYQDWAMTGTSRENPT